jgi:hypothetical protein
MVALSHVIGDVLLRGRPSAVPLLAEADLAKKKKRKPPSDLPPEYRKRDRRRNRIEAEEPEEDDRYQGFAVWNQVAIEGEYKGHPTGDFYLGREEMLAIVRNFQAHPSYEADPALRRPVVNAEDSGHGQVIPWDFHHASEEPGAVIGVNGAPAQSWVHELDMCLGDSGKLELWALVEFLEPAKSYVQQGKYRFASIAFWPNAKDAKTGDDIGPYVSSIAFTNDPFIQGMEPLAAERRGGSLVPDLKKLLDLPAEADESIVLEAVSKLGRAATAQAPEAPGVAPTQTKRNPMPHLLTRIASALGVEVADDASEPQLAVAASKVEAEITTLKAARDRAEAIVQALADKLEVKPEQWDIESGIVTLKSGRDKAMEALNALATALGVEDASAATAKVAELLSASALLQEVMPALSALQGPAKAQEEEEEEREVMEAMRQYLHPDQHEVMKPALLNMRNGGVVLPVLDPKKGVTQFAQDCQELVKGLATKAAKKKEFRERYPLPQPSEQHLLSAYATAPTQPGASPLTLQQPGQPPQPVMPDRPQGERIDLSRYPGRNDTERLMAYVRHVAHQNGEGVLDHDTAWTRAVQLKTAQA